MISNFEYSTLYYLNFIGLFGSKIHNTLPKCFQLLHSLNILIKYQSIFLFT